LLAEELELGRKGIAGGSKSIDEMFRSQLQFILFGRGSFIRRRPSYLQGRYFRLCEHHEWGA